MAKTGKEKKHSNMAYTAYKIEGGRVVRARRSCPKCGQGTFLAAHKSREACGRCGYTEFKKKE